MYMPLVVPYLMPDLMGLGMCSILLGTALASPLLNIVSMLHSLC